MTDAVTKLDQLYYRLRCLLCGSTEALTAEHVFPAGIGGDDVVHSGTCLACNGSCSKNFEAEFINGLKHVCHILGVENRSGEVPSINAVTVIDGTKFNLILRPGGKFEIQEKKEQRILDNGKKVTDYTLVSEASVRRLQDRAARRGERLKNIDPEGRPIEFVPESFMPLDFLVNPCAFRTVAKIAYMALAKVAGRPFAHSETFADARHYIRTGFGSPTRLFVCESYASNTHIGPHQHMVQVYADGRAHTVHGIVAIFGGLTYLVQLSTSYHGADYGCTYGYDALERKQTPVLLGELDTERRAIEDVRFGNTKFDDVIVMAEHWAKYIQAVAAEHIQPVTRRPEN